MPTCRLRFESWRIEVTCPDAADLRWLAAFLAGGFEELPAGPADAALELSVDPDAYARLERSGARAEGPAVEGFAGDAKGVYFEPWVTGEPDRVYHDPTKGIFHRVSSELRRVEIVSRGRHPKLRRVLMRVVRELAMGRVAASGGVLLHASAVHHAGGVVAMSGEKRSGKTTLLCALLAEPGVRYVSNDRCVLRADGTGATIRGLPTLVSLRATDGSSRPSLDPQEFCRRTEAGTLGGGRVRSLVFPQVTSDPTRLALRRLSPAEAAPRLRAGLFRAARPRLLGEVFVSAEEPSHRLPARELLRPWERWITERVPCFECRLGGGAPPGEKDAREMLAALARSSSAPLETEGLHA